MMMIKLEGKFTRHWEVRPKQIRCVPANMPKKLGSVGRKIFLFVENCAKMFIIWIILWEKLQMMAIKNSRVGTKQ